MKIANYWFVALGLTLLLSACADEGPRRPVATGAAPRPAQANGAAKGARDAPLAFEAERAAMRSGCATADGVRPVALLTSKTGQVEMYDVVCGGRRMAVRCEPGACRAVEPLQ